MYVVHLTTSIAPSAGGPAYSIPRLCDVLFERGHHVELLALATTEQLQVHTPHKLFEMRTWPQALRHSPEMWAWINKQCQQQETPNLFHSHNLWGMQSVYPFFASVGWGIPHVVSPRGTLTAYSMSTGSKYKRIYWPLIQLPVLRHATGFHATAQSELEDIRRFGLRQPVAIIPNGIDLPPVCDHTEKLPVLLYLGRLHPEKGLITLLEAWSMVQTIRGNWVLKIVGPDIDDHKSTLQQFIKERNIDGVIFADEIYGSAKYAEYSDASLYVLPSPSENFGMTVAEALSVGIPVIANKGAPWQGLVTYDCGWWVDHGAHALASAIAQAFHTSPSELHAMGQRGRKWMESSFDWKMISEKMEAFYQFILGIRDAPDFVDVVSNLKQT